MVAARVLDAQRQAMLDTAEAVGVGAAFVDRAGRPVAANPAFRTLCADGEARARLAELVNARFELSPPWAGTAELVPLASACLVAAVRVLPGDDMALVQVRTRATPAEAGLGGLRLTPAQQRVARGLAAGLANRTIAHTLGVSEHTARRHTEQIFAKLGVRSRAAAAVRLMVSG